MPKLPRWFTKTVVEAKPQIVFNGPTLSPLVTVIHNLMVAVGVTGPFPTHLQHFVTENGHS